MLKPFELYCWYHGASSLKNSAISTIDGSRIPSAGQKIHLNAASLILLGVGDRTSYNMQRDRCRASLAIMVKWMRRSFEGEFVTSF